MKSRLLRVATLTLVLAAGSTGAQSPSGYLAGREPDVLQVIPQPPALGSPLDRADRAVFRETRSLKGSPRWALAQSDADLTQLLSDFNCALGISLTREDAPRLTILVLRAAPDISAAYNVPKDFYKKARPFTRDRGAICVPRSSGFDKSYDYPSGHAIWAWAVGLVLARSAPDRAAEILARARSIGESRVVCGVHNVSAVEAGRSAADTLISALEGDAVFRADLAAAKAEITTLRSSGSRPDANICRTQTALAARTPW